MRKAQRGVSEMSMALDHKIGTLHGVGPAKVAAYDKLGLHTLGDLLYHFPRA